MDLVKQFNDKKLAEVENIKDNEESEKIKNDCEELKVRILNCKGCTI